jgi:ribosomal protein S8
MFIRLAQLISRINLAKAQRIESFKIPNSRINFAMVFKLEEVGILRGFEVQDGNLLCVYMKYVNKRVPFVKL